MNNRIKSAVKLDFYTMKSAQAGQMMIVIAIVISTLIGFATKQPVFTLAFFMVFAVFAGGTVFSTHEKSRSDRLYGILPLKKSEMISGRYLFALIIGAVSLALAIIISLVLTRILSANFNPLLYLTVLAAAFVYYCFAVGIAFPIYLKYSFAKAYVFTMVPIYAVFLIAFFLIRRTGFLNSVGQSVSFFSNHQAMIPVIGVVAGLIMLTVSALIANIVYRGKEI